MLNSEYKYSQWDGTQSVFDLGAEELMDRLSSDLLSHGDVWKAMRGLMRQGMQDRHGQRIPGLEDLVDQLKDMRRQQLQRYNINSVMEDLERRLQEVLETERQGIQRRLDEANREVEDAEGPERVQKEAFKGLLEQRAQRNLEKLDSLPPSMGGAIKELMEYDFIDPRAQEMFQVLLNQLRSQMAQNMSPEEMAALGEMLRELNQMLHDRAMGREPDFQGFMQRFGTMFGPNPSQNLDELKERLMMQMAQMQALLESMSPEARRQLEEALSSALDPEIQQEFAHLAAMMEQLMPMGEMRRQYPFLGEDNLTLEQAMQLMGNLQSMDDLERTIQEAMRTGDLDAIDPDTLTELLGEESRRTWDQLQELMELLKEAGYVTDSDKPDLTPKAIRKIGQKALGEVFANLKKYRLGGHELVKTGEAGDQLSDTKPYEFGDPLQLDLQATVKNAMVRSGPGLPVHLTAQDFEIYRNQHITQAATVVLLDQSRSMGLFGSFQVAKKVALALFALTRSQFPRDRVYVIRFSDYAREIKEDDLPKVSWNAWVSGTNIHHALMLSRKLLSREKGGTRQIILITDGEPTAHLEGDRSYFSYPPSYKTIMETLKEARRCTQEGIIINTFMLENSYQLMNFVDQLTRINQGRAFYSTPDKLGEYVLVDYVTNRRKRIAS